MKPPPKILPLAAVAIGGVLAFKALDAVGGVSALLPPSSAQAEEVAPRAKLGKPASAPQSAAPAATPAAPAAKPPAPVCAVSPADLAREAGLSPAELSVIQSLSARRGQLDAREQALDAQIQLLAAAEAKVDAKLKALDASKASIQALLGQADAQSQAEVDRLVIVYEKMKPRDAGALMAQLDDKVRVPVAAKMKPAILAAVLPNMGTTEAKKLTENLARRFAAVREQVAAATANPPAAVAAPGSKASAAPMQTAATAPSAAASPAPSKPAGAPRPQRVARAAPPRPRAVKPKLASPSKADPEASPKPDATAKAEPKLSKPAEAPTKAVEKPAT